MRHDPTEKTFMKRISFKNQDGQSVTEFALVLPILAFLLFAVIQFGMVFNNWVQLTDATRAGARKGAVLRRLGPGQAKAQCEAAVFASATNLKQSDGLTANCSTLQGWQPGDELTVTATYPYRISLFGLLSKSGTLSSTTKERVE
jgi:Flp pilus assembly protein TadG